MNIIVAFGCVIIIIILMNIVYRMKHKRYYQLLDQFPAHRRYPLIGNVHLVFGRFDDVFLKIEKICQPFERCVFWLGPVPILLLRKHEDIMTILNQTLERDFFHMSDEWIGRLGILTAPYEEWKKSRKLLSPAFTTVMLSKYVDIFNKNASNLIENLKSAVDTGEEIDVLEHVLKEHTDTIVENFMGVSMERNGKNGVKFCDAMLEAFKNVRERIFSPWLHPPLIYMMYLKLTGKTEVVKQVQNFPTKILKDHLNNDLLNQNIQLSDVDSSRTMIDSLVKRSDFNEIRIRDELIQILLAGVETSAYTVSFLMLMLAIHQDVQQKVYEEIIETTGGDDNITADQSLNQLFYLEQCIRETMRLFGIVTFTTRRTHKECILKGNVIVPAKVLVIGVLCFANRDPELFANPDKWDPEHFSKQAMAERPKGTSQLSFGFGPRSCLGSKYAMMSMKTEMCHILLNYHLFTNVKEVTKNDLNADLIMRSKLGFPIRLTSRQKVK